MRSLHLVSVSNGVTTATAYGGIVSNVCCWSALEYTSEQNLACEDACVGGWAVYSCAGFVISSRYLGFVCLFPPRIELGGVHGQLY